MSSQADTVLLHADDPLRHDSALSPPISYAATFAAADAAQFRDMASQPQHARYYTRYGNPLHERVARVVADLEGAQAGLCFASGMGAISAALLSHVRAGDHVVAQTNHYMGTAKLLTELLPRMGVHVTQVGLTDTAAVLQAVQPRTRLIHLETPVNPTLALCDIAAICGGAKLVAPAVVVSVDNTFASPINQQPIKLGADIVIHSATKYLGGHHDITAGVLVSSAERCRTIWSDAVTLGATLSPMDAWLLLRGLRTLGVRVRQINANALAVATFLEQHPAVDRVFYPGLPSHPQHDLAAKQMSGFGGVMAVWLKTDYAGTAASVARLKLFTQAVSLGGVDSLAVHAAAMWAGTLNDEQVRQADIQPNAVRLSIGLESADDLVADLAQALAF
jgi:cystathionine beta-lyase/cystathionine gamma-synthase